MGHWSDPVRYYVPESSSRRFSVPEEIFIVEAVIRSDYPGSLVGGPPRCSLTLKGVSSGLSVNLTTPCSEISQHNVDDLFDLIPRPKE
jgi:hypothetical protein